MHPYILAEAKLLIRLGMDKQYHPTDSYECSYLNMS